MLSHSGFLRRHVEAGLILVAARILAGRNVHRSAVVSRRDNNDMWGMAERLENIAGRIRNEYREVGHE
ncbi:hypothetical protein [Pseudomonas aeruginosa]|uniref:hypothetical protein n=1 Tax=Pseudomonas aeruginosa TaxID=287 RepID=UPI00093567B2|nr:hypothetical protein [Pseudomonas aeruginosa]HDR3018711.1 hypothetical protein [Pseudomonas aeruginosa]